MAATEKPVVLVVDDNEPIANTYTAFLSDRFEVRTAYEGEQALGLLDEAVDVVLLDRRMPEVSGDAVLEEIEATDLDCQVVMLTAVDPDFDIIDMGFDEYLTKPVERTELNEIVEEMLLRADYDDQFRSFLALASKKSTLEAEKSTAELSASEEYAAVVDRLARKREEVGVDLSELEAELDRAAAETTSIADDGLDDDSTTADSPEPDLED